MKTAKTPLEMAAVAATAGSRSEVADPRMPRAIPTQAEMTIICAACESEVLRPNCIGQRLCVPALLGRHSWVEEEILTVLRCTLGGHASLPGSFRVQAIRRPAQSDRRVGRGHRGGGEVPDPPRHHRVG